MSKLQKSTELAIDGGRPVRGTMLPYGRHAVTNEDVEKVTSVLKSDWLTTGPRVEAYERAVADFVGTAEAVAVSSGTAALHTAVHEAGIGPGDEVIVPAITFAATANCVLYAGGTPIFADVSPETLNIDPRGVASKITPRTKAILPVDYAGQPADLDAIRELADEHGLVVIEDAAQALGATYKGKRVGGISELTTFSTHPVKQVATGEGGIIVTNDSDAAKRMRAFRNHGITTDARQRLKSGTWTYEQQDLGYNYRLPDILCALGESQLARLDELNRQRRELAAAYTRALSDVPSVSPLKVEADRESAWHLYVVQLELERLTADRRIIFDALRAENIGVHVHYIPVYWHPHYERLGYMRGLCPAAEAAYDRILTLPLFPAMADEDVRDVVAALRKVLTSFGGTS